jgi:hypothetical protein
MIFRFEWENAHERRTDGERKSVSISEHRIAQFPGFLAVAQIRRNCAPLFPCASAGRARSGAAIRKP